jgi:Rod binding domain-containing protein
MVGIPQSASATSAGEFSLDAVKKQPGKSEIESAAKQFEGLLIHQLLKSASGEGGGWMGTGEEDKAGLQAMDLAQQQFAQAMAARGGLGLAKMVIPQLTAETQHSK